MLETASRRSIPHLTSAPCWPGTESIVNWLQRARGPASGARAARDARPARRPCRRLLVTVFFVSHPSLRQVPENFSNGMLYPAAHHRLGCTQPAGGHEVLGERVLLNDHLEHHLAELLPLPIEPHLGCRGPDALRFLPAFCPRDVIEANHLIGRQLKYPSEFIVIDRTATGRVRPRPIWLPGRCPPGRRERVPGAQEQASRSWAGRGALLRAYGPQKRFLGAVIRLFAWTGRVDALAFSMAASGRRSARGLALVIEGIGAALARPAPPTPPPRP